MTTSLEQHLAIRQRQSELTHVAWIADRNLSYEEWLRMGSRLGATARGAGWWVGDWVRFGAARYGSKYTLAARVTGYDTQTLMNMVYVATRFQISRRRENLSWSHHAELASLDVDEQEDWLDHATEERLSVRDLRDLIPSAHTHRDGPSQSGQGSTRKGRSSAAAQGSTDGRAAGPATVRPAGAEVQQIVVCPHCGTRFDPQGLAEHGPDRRA
jgi:hypothetical protein